MSRFSNCSCSEMSGCVWSSFFVNENVKTTGNQMMLDADQPPRTYKRIFPPLASYRNVLGHLPIVISASLPSTTYFWPLIFCPSTTVPILVAKSSIVSFERLVRWCAWPSSTRSTLMVRCFREMVLWEMASWPATQQRSACRDAGYGKDVSCLTLCRSPSKEIRLARPQPEPTPCEGVSEQIHPGGGADLPPNTSSFSSSHIFEAQCRQRSHLRDRNPAWRSLGTASVWMTLVNVVNFLRGTGDASQAPSTPAHVLGQGSQLHLNTATCTSS